MKFKKTSHHKKICNHGSLWHWIFQRFCVLNRDWQVFWADLCFSPHRGCTLRVSSGGCCVFDGHFHIPPVHGGVINRFSQVETHLLNLKLELESILKPEFSYTDLMALEQCRCPHCPLFRAWLRDTTTLLYLLHVETRDICDHLKLYTVTSRISKIAIAQ